MAERHGIKTAAMVQAKEATKVATEKQLTVPELLGNAARAVKQLYSTLAEIEDRRQTAMHALAIADRTDYELELKTARNTSAPWAVIPGVCLCVGGSPR